MSSNLINPTSNPCLSVCTFNILAPCYKRLSSERDRESAYDSLWQTRHLEIIHFLQSLELHLICLQEFWLTRSSFIELYETHLSSKYAFHYLQRTGRLDDGLAILFDRTHLKLINKQELLLHDIGNRVGLLLHFEFKNEPLLVINIHLTFPHNSYDRRLRLTQMKQFLEMIQEYQLVHHLNERCSIILCGDFNSASENDSVYQLVEKQFRSSYRVINGKEPKVTHLTHRGDELGVDFIFYQSSLFEPLTSELMPRGCNEQIWNDTSGWELSDHRAIVTTFKCNNNQETKMEL